MKKIIYFDNAATSWPKPPQVISAMQAFIEKIGANPGRSGHQLSTKAARVVFEVREGIADLFNVSDSENVVFTANATHAINMALRGILKSGDHVITSSMEHNSVMRPLKYLEQTRGIDVGVVECGEQGEFNLEKFRDSFNKNTKLVVLTHASNICGAIFPIAEIGRICKENNVLFLVDAAQTAGIYPIDMLKDNIDILAFTGHKGLLGPQGIGGLCLRESIDIEPLMQGGTGSRSESDIQPEFMPDRLESGTLNTVGIAGLGAGLEFIAETGLQNILEHERRLAIKFLEEIESMDKIEVFGCKDIEKQVPVISFNIKGLKSSNVGYMLDKKHRIMCRVGLHCAPRAHKTLGTFPDGTVRFSFSYFNTFEEIDYVLDVLKDIVSFRIVSRIKE
jgi:cysteine desulfurase / selenocysteine lyase